MKPKTQKQALIMLLSKGKPVNWVQAFKETGCSSIARRVSDLIKEGFVFKKKQVDFTTRYKTKGHYIEYTLDVKKTPKKILSKYC